MDKDLNQLGLPPMALAETRDNARSRKDILIYTIVRKTCVLLLLIVVFIGAFLFLSRLLDDFDDSRNTEIFLVTSVSKTSNVTLQNNGLEISFRLKNKSSSSATKRKKRHAFDADRDLPKFKDVDYRKARDIIMNHDVLCNSESKNEICKDIVTKLKTITDQDNTAEAENRKIKEGLSSIITSEDNYRQEIKKIGVIPMDASKREVDSFLLPELTGLSNRDAHGYGGDSYLHVWPPSTHYPQQTPVSHLPDTCLLARLLKQNYPHHQETYDTIRPDYPSGPSYYLQPLPAIPNRYRASMNQDQDDVPKPNKIHPQDVEIFMKFLTPKPEVKPPATNTSSRDAQCPQGTVSCNSGEGCILESQWCNGHVDCIDVSDEAKCSCKSRVDKSRLCDGYFDCPFGEDEMGCYGCSENAFSCEDLDINSKSTCFLKEQRCNNIMDCPNNRDEIDCNMLSPSLHNKPFAHCNARSSSLTDVMLDSVTLHYRKMFQLFATSNTEGFLQRNFKGDWYAVCQNPYMWAHDTCRRETGLIIRPPYIQIVPVDPMSRVNYLNTGPEGLVHTSDTCFNSSAIYVTCPELLCGTRISSTSQLLKENAAIENHLFGRNKRFLLNGRPYPMSFYDPLKRSSRDNSRNIGNYIQKGIVKTKRAESRVVGGKPSKPAAWPWMAAMYRDGMFHCGGVIVTQHWIVSAAHCVHEFWKHYFEVQVGMLRRFSFSPQEQNHRITHIIVNQQYDQADMKNDLSLLRVQTTIQFSRWVRPICLPGPSTAGSDWKWGPSPGTSCTAVGWGATVEHGPDPDHMREVELPIWANCKHSEDREGKEICAGPVEGGKDACQGDSGGPLICKSPLNPQQWYLAGIVSHGDGCARKGEPGVYTRVSLFVKWIKYHLGSKTLPSIQPLQKCPGFKCSSGLNKCLSDKRVCDKIVDCLNGEDEINCSTERSFESLFLGKSSSNSRNTPEDLTALGSENQAKNVISNAEPEKNDKEKNLELLTNKKNDFQYPSTIEMSISKSSEDFRDTSDQATVDPTSMSKEAEFNEHSDVNSLVMTSPRIPLESMSSLLKNDTRNSVKNNQFRESDIQEDWANLSTTPSETSTLLDNVKTNSPLAEQTMTSTTPLPITTQKTLGKTDDGKNDNSEAESKSLVVELLPGSHHADDLTKVVTETGNSDTVENKELLSDLTPNKDDFSGKKIINFDDKLDIIHRIEDIVLSELQPAKIRKKHLTPKEFECKRISQTIPYKHRCDHKPDCEDGTDELSCTCADYLFAFDKTLLCDGIFDCADGQDEIDCFSCPSDRFLCRKSQICLPMKNVCDGKAHCPQGEDETDCFALSNGKELKFDIDERPKTSLEGYLTKKQKNKWQIVCEDNLSTEQQDQAAAHICHYLGFSSANRYYLKHLNVKDEILKSKVDDERKRREARTSVPVHFTYREAGANDDVARHIVIKDPQVLKEECVPNVKKTCMSLYVYCDHGLYTNFEYPQNYLYGRSAETGLIDHMWPWIAKVFVDGNYKCTGVLVDISMVLVSHSCLWDSDLGRHLITAVLGSHRTTNATSGPYEQILEVDGQKNLYRSNIALLHLKKPAVYSNMVKPMVVQSSITPDNTNSTCIAVGQDENNKTLSVFVEETREKCYTHSKCYKLQSKSKSFCQPGAVSSQWAGIISCHTEQGWYPTATFVDSRGECGLQDHIIGTGIENLKISIKNCKSDLEIKKQDMAEKCDGMRCGRGKCIDMRQVCNGVRECEDGNDESEQACEKKHTFCKKDPHDRRCECSTGQFRCHNGRCILKEQFNDGNDDCGDGTDEPDQSTCAKYLARVMPSRLCDGVLHCKDRSDEDPMFCKCFAKRTYPCGKTSDVDHCVAPDVVCDGTPDCPNGEDEQTCIGLNSPQGTPYGRGQVMVRSHGIWHSKCYTNKNHTRSELEVICRELGFISGHAKELEPSEEFKPHPYNNVLIDPFNKVMLNNQTLIRLRNTHTPLARAIFDDKLQHCYPVFIECL